MKDWSTTPKPAQPWSTPAGRLVVGYSADRDTWLEARRGMLCASDMPKIYGASRWGGEYEVWTDKMGIAEATPVTDAQRRGQIFEAAIAQLWSERYADFPIEVRRSGLIRHREQPLGASVDYLSVCAMDGKPSRCMVEVKSQNDMSEWDEEEVPAEYQIQGLTQLAVTGRDHVHYVAIGQRFVPAHRVVYRDEIAIRKLLTDAPTWWQLHITEGLEPMATEKSAGSLVRRFRGSPESEGVIGKDVPEEFGDLLRDIKQAKSNESAAKSYREGLEARAQQLMRDLEVLTWEEGGKPAVTWKAGKTIDGANADWRKANGQLWDEYAVPGPDVLDLDKLVANHPELVGPGGSLRRRRTFSVK